MTLKEVRTILKDAGIDSYDYDARALFHAFSGLKISPWEPLDALGSDSEALASAVARRCMREPLQYVIGKVGFWREEYTVNQSVLIPRADTEHLVEYAIAHLPDGASFIDICTGSGCVGISTLKNTKGTSAVLLDISDAALEVAKINAEANEVSTRVKFLTLDILKEKPEGEYFAVLSNPPYIRDDVYESLEPEIKREPKIAFLGGADGGDFYREILAWAVGVIPNEGFIAFEIGYDERGLMEELCALHGLTLEIIRDYSANDRVAVFRKQIQ